MIYEYTKSHVNASSLAQEIQQSMITKALDKITVFGTLLSIYFKDDLTVDEVVILDDIVEDHTGETLVSEEPQRVVVEGTVTTNKIPPYYTIFLTGISDNLSTAKPLEGEVLLMTMLDNEKSYQSIERWYAIGGRVLWENASFSDYICCFVMAPACSPTQTVGDFDKVSLGGAYNMVKPVAEGTGSWSLDLTEKHTGTNVLKCSPVPAINGDGWFDYDTLTNTIVPNLSQQGSWNLFDFDVKIFCMGAHVFGRSHGCCTSTLESEDVVGKMMLNSWKIKFILTTTNPLTKAAVELVVAKKSNC